MASYFQLKVKTYFQISNRVTEILNLSNIKFDNLMTKIGKFIKNLSSKTKASFEKFKVSFLS